MRKHKILFSVTENSRDGIDFQVEESEIPHIIKNKDEILMAIEHLRKALINETYPFYSPNKERIK